MPHRMLSYQLRIWDRCRKERPRARLPLVVAVLVSHAPGGWSAPRAFEHLFDPRVLALPGVAALVPRCSMIALDLAHRSDAALQACPLPLFQQLVLWALRDARTPARLLASFDAWTPALTRAGPTRSGRDALALLFGYLVRVLDPLSWNRLLARLRTLAPATEVATMTAAEMFEARGRAEGRIATLRSLLRFKFHALDAAAESRLRAATPAAIDRYLRRLLTADSLAAVFSSRPRSPARRARR